ncbi:insulin-degrading enzyme [Pyrenophora tritici-repentis]|uniref:Insulin-degrading enzyme n=1 Tax=Pyrenophora tritici-repentis TaxID=45151 RepID=A0A834S250_9PLEO|nr:insulin-degrading enzyme [Pyrenophora tritici-repentis]KAG9387017.1 insulin-degrading enzyme [Pyrenophora tritici-repentis]KAI1508839.1 Peptidase M16 inactive domain containing protein [Pyrenophora tritici-repentis]KAI1560701.1 insulin-degrading enzyme [Pyrenophora tritici-repentis]KAI1575807.1 insulin-degrading enzyme [Pyrenophora tritici-repentis]
MDEDLLLELENVTAQDVQQFFPQILAQCHVEVLAHSNLYKGEALEITDLVERTIKPKRLPANQAPTPRGLIWPSGSNFIYKKQLKDPGNVNHCIEYSLYAGHRYDIVMRAKLLLLGQMTDEPCFNQLRTIEQLGYNISSGASFHDIWSGYRILIESEKDCRYLEGRIENFFNIFEQMLNNMSEEEFEGHKRAMINKRLAKLKNLSSEDNRFWNHIYTDVDGATLEKLTKEDMIDFYSHYISTSSSQRSKLSVHLQAQAKAKEPSLDEKKTAPAAALKIVLTEHKIAANDQAFQARIKNASSNEAISDAVASHLTDDLIMEKEVADKALDEAKAALNVADSGFRAAPQALDVSADVKSVVDTSQPVLIEDVHAWKASMQASSAVRPVRNLEEFVEVTDKLQEKMLL